MDKNMIRVENLGKCYYIGVSSHRHQPGTLIGKITNSLITPIRRLANPKLARASADHIEELWALRNISFELNQGEVLGIIGRNGSGKSTLLKLICHITAPSEGFVKLNGRVGSLLEVGIGFHPDLTGRENIYLSGAVQGFKRGEIDRLFDEIVDFSEIEHFIDTPVKRYSSGMYVRLAFSVAAHFDQEILILDEVLAVGDASFQKKCLAKMEGVAKSGKTVLYVSHSMQSVTRICDRGLYLGEGKELLQGSVNEVVGAYLKDIQKIDDQKLKREMDSADQLPTFILLNEPDKRAPWATKMIFNWLSVHDRNGNLCSEFETGDILIIRIGFETDEELLAYGQINFMDYVGMRIMQLNVTHNSEPLTLRGKGFIEIIIHDLRLLGGKYIIMFDMYSDPAIQPLAWRDSVGDTIHIKVRLGDYLGGDKLMQGQVPFAQKSSWNVQFEHKR
jgi:lipopolysaccharide transport system ATP-binding protein